MPTSTRKPVAKPATKPVAKVAAKPAAKRAPAKAAEAKPTPPLVLAVGADKKAKKPKRVRGSYAMPKADYARIARLKLLARRTGIDVKKNELFRLGLQSLQTLSATELHDLVLSLRLSDVRKDK